MTRKPKYQLFGKLRKEEYAALEADIKQRGVMVPVEKDGDGNTLDGHHREEIAKKYGAKCPTVVRKFKTETEKQEHVIKLNLCRRHLEPWQWGEGFEQLLKVKGVPRGRGKGDPHAEKHKTATMAVLAEEVGVPLATAEKRLRANAKKRALPRKAQKAIEDGVVKLADAIREHKREEQKAKLEDTATKKAKAVKGLYDVLVVDPPWPMEKIERDERPNQAEMDYPTMDEEQLAALSLPTAGDCHVWLWTTHRFLPMAFRLLDAWGLKYVCTFVWYKPGGFQPVGLPQYNCEFALYARKGSPTFIDTKAFSVCFNAPRTKHSEKPEAFYNLVRRVTAGRRLDMFNRRKIKGFDGWGNEA